MAQNKQQISDKGIQAIEQIKTKNYADKFKAEQIQRQKPIVMMGVVFGKEERNIVEFVVEVVEF